jgi:hypothetical protein
MADELGAADALPSYEAVTFLGPFHHHDVVVGGRQVPYLRASLLDEGRVHLTLDRRLGLTLSAEEAERVVPFLADAIAVGLGYTSHPAKPETDDPVQRHPFPAVEPLLVE